VQPVHPGGEAESIEGLLEESKGMFEVKAKHVGPPDTGEVWRARITPPPPEHVRVMRLPGQTTHTNLA